MRGNPTVVHTPWLKAVGVWSDDGPSQPNLAKAAAAPSFAGFEVSQRVACSFNQDDYGL